MSEEKQQIKTPQEISKKLVKDERINEVLSKVPEDIRGQVLTIIKEQSFFSGPLPPPELFKQYEEILPGSANRIMEMAEKEQDIRKENITSLISIGRLQIWGSMAISLVLILGFIGAGIYCAKIGQPIVGGVLGGLGIVPMIMRIIELLTRKENRMEELD